MSNNAPDYKDNLFFEPDYSIYQTARMLRRLARERNFNFYRQGKVWLESNNLSIAINITNRMFITLDNQDFILYAKSNKHLVDIVEVLTRSWPIIPFMWRVVASKDLMGCDT